MSKPEVNVEEKPRSTSLVMSGLVVLSAVNAGVTTGLDRLHQFTYQRMVERLYRQGETKESLLRRVDELPIPPQLKDVVSKHVENLTNEPPAIEIESTVEEAD